MTARVLATALLLAVATAPAWGQISPGPLARAHRELEGALSCTKCHGPKRETMSAQCLSCHRDVAWTMQRQRGYHAREAGPGKRACESCHPDHAGAGFALISWPGGAKERFDHRQAGWPLEQRHADVTCEDCHATANRVSEAARLSKRTSGAGWMGLEGDCWSCHQADDTHRGALDRKCETCHDASTWDRAPKFDHADTDYPLTGRHADVACAECHLAPRLAPRTDAKGERIPVYTPVSYASCADCHADPHRGQLSATCSTCHTTRTFAVDQGRGFDHARTKYPLTGRHRTVACEACHGENLITPRPASATCGGCHQDPHRGAATLAGKPADCGACHGLGGFTPSTYTAERHVAAGSPLEGKHREVACRACHTGTRGAAPPPKDFPFRVAARLCGDCHSDAHAGAFAARASGSACESCHAVAGWTPSTFSVAQHAATRLPLEGPHAAAACGTCHRASHDAREPARPGGSPAATMKRVRGASGPAASETLAVVALPPAECGACHVDPHGGRYRDHTVAGNAGCRACHATAQFRPANMGPAEHARFGFALDGAHRAAPCADCHEELKRPTAARTRLADTSRVRPFPAAPRAAARSCAACHQTPHGSQFDGRPEGGRCERCHSVNRFVPASAFNHERDAAFSLGGAHAAVPCAACHLTASDGPVPVTRYRPLSTACESCHGRRPPGGSS